VCHARALTRLRSRGPDPQAVALPTALVLATGPAAATIYERET
jgi:hypothetical protein